VVVKDVNAERVSRFSSWVVGAVRGKGGGLELEKPLMDQRVMCCSLSALERIRSPWNQTLLEVSWRGKWREEKGTSQRLRSGFLRLRSADSRFVLACWCLCWRREILVIPTEMVRCVMRRGVGDIRDSRCGLCLLTRGNDRFGGTTCVH
jgi:hypothetical protein